MAMQMNLGNNLIEARKKSGLSQEMVAEKLGVSRQTISKWETAETPPDVYQANCLSKIYNLSLDELMNFDIELNKIEKEIENSNEERDSKIDWTKAWGGEKVSDFSNLSKRSRHRKICKTNTKNV